MHILISKYFHEEEWVFHEKEWVFHEKASFEIQ